MFLPSSNGRSASPLTFVLTDALRLTCEGPESLTLEKTDDLRLLLVLQGTLEAKIEQRAQSAGPGVCLLIVSGSDASLISQGAGCDVCLLSFTALNARANGSAVQRILQLLSGRTKLPAAVLHEYADSLKCENRHQDGLPRLGRQSRFLSLLSLLLEQCVLEEKKQLCDPKHAVKQTLSFMQKNYSLNLTIQQLADMARLPRWQYLRVFKKMTGSNPSSYMTRLRIEQAKRLLSDSDGQVWEVAHRVGYQDEHYFNRRFKLATGISPGQYARIYAHRPDATDRRGTPHRFHAPAERIVYDDAGTLGDLLALDIAPVGANLRFCDNDSFTDKIQSTQEIGFPLNPDKIRTLNPDLVLLSRYGSDRHPELSAIAPTIGLNEYAPMHLRMQKLGEVLGIRERTRQWLDAYDMRREKLWHRLQSRKARHESATVLFYDCNGRLYLLHRLRGLAKLLYHPLGFRMDERVQRLRPARGHYYISIASDRLSEYAVGDRLFVFTHPGRHTSDSLSELNRWPGWNRLPAVQAGKIHYLDSFWNSDDAFTSQLTLERFPDLWS
ncbi:helix-turn-helix domain-containing protein [Cohnella phaseoli]|uniref:ABC-type Fe3+-hydroxamate transport system substrate-binding protein n=1 Tax=Cohnella phaseoli TaxID=456490 RepID=A0A3D9IBD5_9BACL|nr:helix-turn-helix domain-containing protein [Cohnella phaseoli]RED59082.1 ABC-type Fe3+-hydroxamate transport system substrate-binding protein [Cohnella phaseoli]